MPRVARLQRSGRSSGAARSATGTALDARVPGPAALPLGVEDGEHGTVEAEDGREPGARVDGDLPLGAEGRRREGRGGQGPRGDRGEARAGRRARASSRRGASARSSVALERRAVAGDLDREAGEPVAAPQQAGILGTVRERRGEGFEVAVPGRGRNRGHSPASTALAGGLGQPDSSRSWIGSRTRRSSRSVKTSKSAGGSGLAATAGQRLAVVSRGAASVPPREQEAGLDQTVEEGRDLGAGALEVAEGRRERRGDLVERRPAPRAATRSRSRSR